MTGGETHKVVNQSPPYGGVNLFEADPLVNSAASGFPDSVRQELSELGAFWGTHEAREFARLANRYTPELERYNAQGERIDQVTFHPGLPRADAALDACRPALLLLRPRRGRGGACGTGRARVRLYMTAQTECGHLCPMTMTNASLATLKHAPELLEHLGAAHPVAQLRPQFPPGRGEARRHDRHGHDGEAGRHRRARQH